MDGSALAALLHQAVPGVEIELSPSVDLQTTFFVPRESLPAVARVLRDHPDLRFTLLAELTAADFYPRTPRFELVYMLVSIERRLRIRVKVRLETDDPRVRTVSDLWPAANWLEREVWDLFGITFDAHPDPRRLLMPEDWDGYPLRKDYPVQILMTPRTSEPLQVTEQEFRANLQKDRLARG
jgi:NADH-quinone oxidoreductase subunit C